MTHQDGPGTPTNTTGVCWASHMGLAYFFMGNSLFVKHAGSAVSNDLCSQSHTAGKLFVHNHLLGDLLVHDKTKMSNGMYMHGIYKTHPTILDLKRLTKAGM